MKNQAASAKTPSDGISEEAGAKPTPMRGRRSREITRQKLIDAALRVMSRKGVDGTAINDITEEADVGFGSFYNHFPSKGDIAREVFNLHAQRLKIIIREITATEPDRAVSCAFIFRLFLTKAISDPIWGSFVVNAAAELPGMWSEVFEAIGVSHLQNGDAEGRFAVSNPKGAMRLIIAVIIASMRALIEGSAETTTREDTVECLLRMIGIQGDEAIELSKRELPDYVTEHFAAQE